jgi:hypothetical protein
MSLPDPTALGAALGAAVKKLLDPLRMRVKELEALEARLIALKALETRVAALEKALQARTYQGTWDSERTYEAENTCTLGGNLWIAKRVTYDRPGTSDAWQLAVKRGRNGKDASRDA